jgi:diguanylate cyclase (GGDEF)-like protein
MTIERKNSIDDTLLPDKVKVGIVGCNKAASSFIEFLRLDPATQICFVFDSDASAPGIRLAEKHRILILDNLGDIKTQPVDLLLNLSGSDNCEIEIKEALPEGVELLGAKSAKLIFSIIDERRKRLEERDRTAAEREIFRSMGLHMEKIDNMKDAGFAIIDYAAKISTMPAGAISYYDEDAKEMVLVASNSLEGFEQNMRWPVDKCAATRKVLGNKDFDPETLDSFELEQLPNEYFNRLSVKSIIAVPLVLKEKLHSIVYLCDFAERIVLREDIDSLALLGVYASLIMDKVMVLEKMRHLIVTDGLTGLSNQRYFMERLEKEFQRSKRHGHDLSIVIFEIDDFKPYIDEYGHLEGNELLKHLSGLLNKSIRETDTAARFGVEKFCILLCEIAKEGAFTFAQRLVERIASFPMPKGNITVSAGVASFPRDANGYMELLSRGEGNLHKAKEWGKNRACT